MKSLLALLLVSASFASFAETHTYYCGPHLSATGFGVQQLEFDVYRDKGVQVDMQVITSKLSLNNNRNHTIVETSGVAPTLINKIKLLCGYVDQDGNEQDTESIIQVPAKAWTCSTNYDESLATCTAPN